MRQFLIFSICVCFAAAETSSSEDFTLLKGQQKLIMEACAREYNVDEKKYAHGIGEKEIEANPAETSCILACGVRKMFSEEITGSDNKEKLYNGFTKLIDYAYQNGFDKEEVDFTRAEVANQVEKCYASAKNECDFVKCSEFFDGPLLALFAFTGQHENPIFVSDD